MREKYKPAASIIIIGAILSCSLVLSLASPRATPSRGERELAGGTMNASGSSTYFYTANNTASGGIWITCNNTVVDRLNRSIGFSVNATAMLQAGGWNTAVWGTTINKCELNITYPNRTKSFLLQKFETTTIFSFTWRTNVSLPVGFYEIRANIWNATHVYTGGFDFNPVTKVSVVNISPIGSVVLLNMNGSAYYRNETMEFLMSIFDPETPFTKLVWNVTLFKLNGSEVPTTWVATWNATCTLNQTYKFTGNNVLGKYVFFIEIYDDSGGYSAQTVSEFTVLNNPPVIHGASYNFTSNLKRVTETMHFEVNVTDPDNDVKGANVVAILQQVREPSSVLPRLNYTSSPFTYNAVTGNFTGNLTVGPLFPLGNATIIIKATDNETSVPSLGPAVGPATGYYYPQQKNVTIVTNNLPVLNGVTINGKSLAAGLRFPIYNNLDFIMNASDIEDNIDYVQISLIGPNGENVTYYALGPSPYKVRVTTAALSTGSWGVFVTVVDREGGSSGSINAGVIEVDPDLRDVTAYIIGGVLLLIAGFVVGGMIIWRYANARISAIRRDMIIKTKSKEGLDAKKGKPGEKGTTSKYVEPSTAIQPEMKPEPKPEAKPETKPSSKPAEKPAASRSFTGTQAPATKGKQPAPEKKQDGSKPKSK
ncbi:MAG: hypothetical protein Q6353_020750 [Candidatus Sigynarchaeum springense]